MSLRELHSRAEDSTIKTEYIARNEMLSFTNQGLFHHPSWLNAIEQGLGHKCFGLLTRNSRNPVALSIFFENRKGGIKLAGSPLPGSFTPYIEPIWTEHVSDDIKTEILINQHFFLRKMGFSYIERRFREGTCKSRWTDIVKCNVSFPETFLLNIIPDTETMWNQMESRSRNMIRKAEKAGVEVFECNGTQAEIEEFYRMLKVVFAKSGKLPTHPLSFYRSISEYLTPENRILILSARLRNNTIAMGLFIHDNNEIHFLSGASLPEAYMTGANNLIQWNAIKFGMRSGIKTYDLGGKGIPSIDKFKSSFGGRTHPYVKMQWKTPVAAIAEKGYLFFLSLLSGVNRIKSL